MKILNLYAGIGGNRKLWPGYICECGYEFEYKLGKYGCPNCCGEYKAEMVDVTAVEIDEEIAKVYSDHYPNDTLVIDDAHQYLLEHYNEFDFIWSSPPCPTHSNARFWSSKGGMYDVVYPDMALYQEIIFLNKFYNGKYLVENVKPYYDPLIDGKIIGRHIFWSNFKIGHIKYDSNYIFGGDDKKKVRDMIDIDTSRYTGDETKILRNCVHPKVGKHIFNRARDIIVKSDTEQTALPL